jgi:hypothetical protein
MQSKPEIRFNIFSIIKKNILYRFFLPFTQIILPFFHGPTKIKLNNFRNFHDVNSKFSKRFESIVSLYNYSHKYDVFITGSDQVWNPATFTSLKPYFLDFAPQDKIKISYAPSFGVSKIMEGYHEFFKEQLNNLDIISVREKSGQNLVKKISNKDSVIVLDPTLLLNKSEWKAVINYSSLNKPKKYVLVYQLHDSEDLISIAIEIGKRLKLPILSLCKRSFLNKKYKNIINVNEAGPSEFIELFYDASYVITNSFHGTVFSVNFNIPFYSVLNKLRTNNSRIIDFLNLINLPNRVFWEGEFFVFENLEKIDFKISEKLLNENRLESLNFIIKSCETKL